MACRKTKPTFYSLSSIPFFPFVLSLFLRFFSASFLYSRLDIPLEFPFLFRMTDSRLYGRQQDGRSIFPEGRNIFLFPTKFRPLYNAPGLISRFACERQKSCGMKQFADSHLTSSFRLRRT